MIPYDFYKDTFMGGSITFEEWPMYEARAREQLERYKRIYTVTAPKDAPCAEDKAVCAMADALAYFVAAQNGGGGPVSSASIGSVSVSYGGASWNNGMDLSPKGQERELFRCACLYLDIYRGVG